MEKYFPLSAEYGAALIGLAHDERGINYNIEERVEAAATIIDVPQSTVSQRNIF